MVKFICVCMCEDDFLCTKMEKKGKNIDTGIINDRNDRKFWRN